MAPRYILLKSVPVGGTECDDPVNELTMHDLEGVVRADQSVFWGEDPRGPMPVKNSDGSVTIMKAYSGFSFTPTPGMEDFFICYEFNGGICIHTEEQESVCQKCREFADALGVTVFPTE